MKASAKFLPESNIILIDEKRERFMAGYLYYYLQATGLDPKTTRIVFLGERKLWSVATKEFVEVPLNGTTTIPTSDS